MSDGEIRVDLCRVRQQRLLAEMHRREIEMVIVTRIEHVQWLTGVRYGWVFEPAAALDAHGRCRLAAPNRAPEIAAADDVITYEAQWHSTLRNDQREASSTALLRALTASLPARRVGVEFSACGQHLLDRLATETVDIEPALFRLRRTKEADELARLRRAIAATGAMYARAREIIRPGVVELDVFNELQAVAVRSCGEMLTGTGNDYASGVPGGPPRDRPAEAGELYLLDLGPAYRGYFADNCRAFSVDGRPTDEQLAAWQKVGEVFAIVEQFVKPGASCKELFNRVQAHLDESTVGTFAHHLGHGIGLFPHEAPHLNPFWDDRFEAGDVFTAEPGLYASGLRAGIRLENDYLVTDSGVELLSDFPLEL
jgi:Xaa-Pro aminopeptidase